MFFSYKAESNLLDESEAADYLGIKTSLLRQWRLEKKVPFPYIHDKELHYIRYRISDIEEYLRRHIKV
jgi:predicted DNA-binding transcriptional regulator AlpA